MIDLGKHNVVGVQINAVDYEAAVEQVVRAAQERQPLALSALAVHGVMTGVLDPQHRHRLNHFDLLVPDGQPVRWALRWLHGAALPDRVYGPTLMLRICERAAKEGLPIFLFGGTDQLLERLSKRLVEQFPRLAIAGTLPSRFRQLTEAEREQTIATICESGAAITFIGLGCPRQEVCAYELREELSMPLLAVGAAFNFHAGLLPQAPRWMQDRGLEWLYRLVSEPARLWRRYLFLNPAYLACVLLQRSGLNRFSPHGTSPPTDQIRYG